MDIANIQPTVHWATPLKQSRDKPTDKKASTKRKAAHSLAKGAGFVPLSTIAEGDSVSELNPAINSNSNSNSISNPEQRIENNTENNTEILQLEITQLHQMVTDLTNRNQVLTSRCQSLSAWAEQHRIATAKIQTKHQDAEEKLKSLQSEHTAALQALAATATQPAPTHALKQAKGECACLTEALSNIDRQHTILQKEHMELKAGHATLQSKHSDLEERHASLREKHSKLKERHSALKAKETEESDDMKTQLNAKLQTQLQTQLKTATDELEACKESLRSSQARATEAERTVQSILSIKALLKNAPVPVALLSKASAVLQSAVDVLGITDGSGAGQVRRCTTQVSTALSELDEEISTLASASAAWVSKREIILRPQSQHSQQNLNQHSNQHPQHSQHSHHHSHQH